MTVKEMAAYITHQQNATVPYPYGDEFVVVYHVRTVLYQHIHITKEHVLQCCTKASGYEEFIELCRPLAKADTERWHQERIKPPKKGRTRRRFR